MSKYSETMVLFLLGIIAYSMMQIAQSISNIEKYEVSNVGREK